MKLIIDLGNTNSKLGLFNNEELVQVDIIAKKNFRSLKKAVSNQKNIHSLIVSSVVNYPGGLLNDLQTQFGRVLFLDEQTPLPLHNKYQSKSTLGNDRLAAAVAASAIFPDNPSLVIDCGTCITYDLVNEKQYLGGAISPGMDMRFKALHTFTDKLPLAERKKQYTLTGSDTMASIHSGVQNGILSEIKETINQYQSIFPGLRVLMTGGDMNFFENELKNYIFAEPWLTLKGLNSILDYNNDL